MSKPIVFTMFVDEILGSLISKWSAQSLEWSFNHLLMTCLACADVVLLFGDLLENMIRMFNDCRPVRRKHTGVLLLC